VNQVQLTRRLVRREAPLAIYSAFGGLVICLSMWVTAGLTSEMSGWSRAGMMLVAAAAPVPVAVAGAERSLREARALTVQVAQKMGRWRD
jgi:hypothetical protein